MSTQKIIPVDDESAMLVNDLLALDPNMVTQYQSAGDQEAKEDSVVEEVDTVAPLVREKLPKISTMLADNPVTVQTAVAHKVPPKILQKSPTLLAKTASVQALLGVQQTKAAIRAQQELAVKRSQIPSQHHSRSERVAYMIDQYISTRKGQTLSLGITGLCLIIIGGCVLKASQPSMHFSENVWESWTFLADPGSHTAMVLAGPRVVGVLTTLVGILYFSVIMGFVVDGIREKMDNLKKGKTQVAEVDHTVILGWTDKSISLIRQICLANASEKGGVVVVLSETEKEELEAELASHLTTEELRGTQVIFRTGTPLLSVDLIKVAAHRARSIIIMAQSTGDADRSDAAVLRTVLSLKTLPELSGHIVAELRDIDNDPLVRLVGGDDVEIVVSHDVIGRLVLMSARSPGLARVYSSLLGFEGNEFYFKEWPECVGAPFRGLCERFPNAIPLGIKKRSGEVIIFPNFDMVIEAGDQILVLAEDDDTYKACPPVSVEAGSLPTPHSKQSAQEHILMCGWRRDIRDMIQLLDFVVSPGTELHMICEEPVNLRNKLLQESGLSVDALKNLRLVHHYGNTAIRRHLEALPWKLFTSIMILSDQSREADIMHSDSHSLASLLLIRDLQKRAAELSGEILESYQYCKCISEILDPRTQRTISTSSTILKLSEFIQSNELVSCILAMISESRDVRVILDELLGPKGAAFEVENATQYCAISERVSFWQLSKRAMMKGEILCGYQMRGAIEETILNPPDKDKPRTWYAVDMIVLRSSDKESFHEPAPSSIVQSDDFERTSKNRLGKSSFMRHQVLEAIIHEQSLATVQDTHEENRKTLTKAVRSFVEMTHNDSEFSRVDSMTDVDLARIDPGSIRSLVAVARLLADALENASNMRDDQSISDYIEEKVSEYIS